MASVKTSKEDEIDLRKASPSTARSLFCEGKYLRKATGGMCQGYVQANLVMLPSELSDSFLQFCKANCGPLPLLFNSKKGQFDAPPLTTESTFNSDIRTDLTAYSVIENGEYSRTVGSLEEFGEQMANFSFFYLGCSFSFDKRLLSAGVPLRNLDKNGVGNTSMYTTNIKCKRVGKFDCKLVVSMRAIPAELVQKAYECTHIMKDVHGAPVHIGNPAIIGIEDISQVDYGVPTTFQPSDVAVFWCCGVTGLEAVKSVNAPLAFTHCPGSMFISDCLSSSEGKEATQPVTDDDQPTVIWLSENPPLASAASQAAVDVLAKLENICQDDPGNRRIDSMFEPGDLMKSALCLSHARSVAIVTGYPALLEKEVPFETDGPPGAIALAIFLQSLGINVTLILDTLAGFDKAMESIVQKLKSEGIIKIPFNLEVYPRKGHSGPPDLLSALDYLTEGGDINKPRFDHLLAIERPGMATDGNYYTMRAKNISHLVTNTDLLFEAAKKIPTTFTTAIGDGGNELGMGKVHDRIKRHVLNGEIIASEVPADFVIACGVSNWGGYALCFALFALRSDMIHDRHRRRGLGFPLTKEEKEVMKNSLPTQKQEETVLRVLMDHKFLDMTEEVCMAVDGLDFYSVHMPKLLSMVECIN